MTFHYEPRPRECWEIRARQTRDVYRLESALPVTAPAVIPTKLTAATLCVCGHTRARHCLVAPELHWTAFGTYFCLFEHCAVVSCICDGFQLVPTNPLTRKYPRADDYTACARCSHWRIGHCHKRQKFRRVEHRWENTEKTQAWRAFVPWSGFCDERGIIQPCRHTPEDPNLDYFCNSTSCATVVTGPDGTEDFCPCQKFVDPFDKLRRTSRAALKAATPAQPTQAKPRKPRTPRKKGFDSFITGQGTLFPVHVVGETSTND
jgi:hypothetical protein